MWAWRTGRAAPFVRSNIKLNGHDGEQQRSSDGLVSVHAVDYDDRGTARRIRGAFSTVVAAALIYDKALHTALLATLVELQPSRLILANSAWSPDATTEFLARLSEHFECRLAYTAPPTHQLGGGGYSVDVWECTAREALYL